MSISLPDFDYTALLSEGESQSSRDGVRDRFAALVERTEALFPGGVRVTLEEDAEVEGDWYFVFHVKGGQDFPVLSLRRREWYEACHELLAAQRGKLRLSVEFRE